MSEVVGPLTTPPRLYGLGLEVTLSRVARTFTSMSVVHCTRLGPVMFRERTQTRHRTQQGRSLTLNTRNGPFYKNL